MSEIEVFVQGEGLPEVIMVRVPEQGTIGDIVAAAKAHGLKQDDKSEPVVLLEDADEAILLDATLSSAGIGHRSHVHVHSCRKIEITVNFNGKQAHDDFRPSATIKRVKKWADEKFKLRGVDATEHLLQACGGTSRPDEDVHVGSLVRRGECSLCFDLVPKQRVEG